MYLPGDIIQIRCSCQQLEACRIRSQETSSIALSVLCNVTLTEYPTDSHQISEKPILMTYKVTGDVKLRGYVEHYISNRVTQG